MKQAFLKVWLSNFYDPITGKINLGNIAQLLIRSLNFFMLSFLVIIASDFAQRAGVNFGIVASCMCMSTPLNCLLSYLCWGEKLTLVTLIGTSMVIIGVIWVSLTRGNDETNSYSESYSEEERNLYRIMSISCALFTGVLNALRTFQAKYVQKKSAYGPIDFSIDGGLCTGLVLMVCAFWFWLKEDESYTLYNVGISFTASVILMLTSLMGLYAMVNGLAGPTSAIMSTNSIVQTILNILILGFIPTIM